MHAGSKRLAALSKIFFFLNQSHLKESYYYGLIAQSASSTELSTSDRGKGGGVFSSKRVPRSQPRSEGDAKVDRKCHVGVACGTWAILTPLAQIWTPPAQRQDESSILTPPPQVCVPYTCKSASPHEAALIGGCIQYTACTCVQGEGEKIRRGSGVGGGGGGDLNSAILQSRT